MLTYYKRSLIGFFARLRNIHLNPYENLQECQRIQEDILVKIQYVEKRIRLSKALIKGIKRELGTKRFIALTKAESQKIKDQISNHENKLDEYQRIRQILSEIGDGIAFTYIDKWEIKPMTQRESPGFISDKIGGKVEDEFFRSMFEAGIIAIRNDITSCLRFADVTIPRGDGSCSLVECKLIQKGDIFHGGKQLQDFKLLNEYLSEDKTTELYGSGNLVMRVANFSLDVYRHNELNLMIKEGVATGISHGKVEEGLYYLILTPQGYANGTIRQFVKTYAKEKYVLFMVNNFRHNNLGYYPFTLSIHDPHALYMFYDHQLVVQILLDYELIEKRFSDHGLDVEYKDDGVYALRVINRKPTEAQMEFLDVSRHMFNRIFAEFLSLDWFINEVASKVLNPPSQL